MRENLGHLFVTAYRHGVAVVIRLDEQVPDNRLREIMTSCCYLVVLTLCDCVTRMMQTDLARTRAKCDRFIWMIRKNINDERSESLDVRRTSHINRHSVRIDQANL